MDHQRLNTIKSRKSSTTTEWEIPIYWDEGILWLRK